MSDQSSSTFHEEIMLLAEKMGELHDRFAKIETEFSAQTAPLDAAKSTQDSALVALNAALEGIKQLNFHVLDNNLGAVSKRVEEVGQQADTAIKAVDEKIEQESTQRTEAFAAIKANLAKIESARLELSKTREQDTQQFATKLDQLNQEIAYARETLASELQAAIKRFAEPAGLNPMGKWDPQKQGGYARLDIVSLNGSSYVSMASNNTEKPGRGSKLWGILAARGGAALGGGATDITGVAGIGATGLLLVQSATASDARDILGVNDFTGATALVNGTAGRVIQPSAGDQTKYLRGDGTWTTPSTVTAPAASQSEVDAGTEDAKYVNPVTLHGYVEPLINQRQPAPRILSDGATTNRAIIGQFGDVGDVAGSPATFAIENINVPTSNPTSDILLASSADRSNPAHDEAYSLSVSLRGGSSVLAIRQSGAVKGTDRRTFTATTFRSDYSGEEGLRITVSFPEGDSTTTPTIHCNGQDITSDFIEATNGTDPNWQPTTLDTTYFISGLNSPSGDAPIARLYNYAWSDADALAWTGGGAMPADAENPAQAKYAADWSSTVDSWAINGSGSLSVSSSELVITGGVSAKRNFANTPINITKFRVYSAFTVHATIDLKYWNGSSFVDAISGWDGSEQVVTIPRAGTTLIWAVTGASAFNLTAFESTPLGAIDAPIIQPGLTTGDKHGRFSRRLLGMKSVPNTDRGQIIINTAASADVQGLGGPLFENTTDYVLDGPIEQVPDGGTPDTDIGSTSGGVDYKATSTLASGVNPFTAVTRKVGATSIYVGSDDTTPVRTFIPFRKISTP